MKVTVQLDQAEIIKAIRFYLEENSVPTGDGKAFPIEIYFKDAKVEQGNALMVKMTFEAEDFSTGPYR